MTDTAGKDSIVALLDEVPAPPAAASKIAHDLLLNVSTDDELVKEVMRQYDSGFENDDDARNVRKLLFNKMDNIETSQREYLYRLAISSLISREQLDGYGAEYFFSWSSNAGLTEEKIVEVFASVLRMHGYDI